MPPMALLPVPAVLYLLLAPTILVTGLVSLSFPSRRAGALSVLRAGTFGALAGSGMVVAGSLFTGGVGSLAPDRLLAVASFSFATLSLAAIWRGRAVRSPVQG